jgi:PilZ domain
MPSPANFSESQYLFRQSSAHVSESAALHSYNGFRAATFTERNDTMTQASFAKRRANPRFSFFAEAEVILHDGTSVLGQISELSSRGCYIDMLQPIPIGTELRLCFSDGTSSSELPGKVIYMHSGGGLGIFGIGVLFGELTVSQYSALDMWLRELAGRRIQRRSQTDSSHSS